MATESCVLISYRDKISALEIVELCEERRREDMAVEDEGELAGSEFRRNLGRSRLKDGLKRV